MVNVIKRDIVKLGSTVIIEISGKQYKYTILEEGTAKIEKNEISKDSPIGKNILGHEEGEVVRIDLPESQAIKCKILKIK